MASALHHLHKRKRVHHKLEKYPHKHEGVRLLDRIILVVAILGPLMNIPQILKIYIGKNPAGISLLTFASYATINLTWIIYGIVHKEKPIIIAFCLWFTTNLIIIAGILTYS